MRSLTICSSALALVLLSSCKSVPNLQPLIDWWEQINKEPSFSMSADEIAQWFKDHDLLLWERGQNRTVSDPEVVLRPYSVTIGGFQYDHFIELRQYLTALAVLGSSGPGTVVSPKNGKRVATLKIGVRTGATVPAPALFAVFFERVDSDVSSLPILKPKPIPSSQVKPVVDAWIQHVEAALRAKYPSLSFYAGSTALLPGRMWFYGVAAP